MNLTEKAAYLKGLMDGLKIDDSTNEGKVLLAMYDLLSELAESVDEIDQDVDDIVEFCNVLDEDLANIENDLYDDEDDDYDDDYCDDECDCDDCCDCEDCDDDRYEVVCPTCGDTIELTLEMVEEGSIECPNCGELLEFDIEEECDCGCCDED
ncbi:MAG: hypothetical protein IJ424_04535 [Oscillospiraceae bacterium]|nr:hypothetical protein [Oscillospiraceae bacterium]